MHFDKAFRYVILNEGEYSNNPTDRGKETFLGITQYTAGAHKCILHPQGIDVKKVTLEIAKHIYKEDYWQLNGIDDVRIAVKLFDYCVNFGVKTGIMLAQETANLMGSVLAVDGVCGAKTADEINTYPYDRFLDNLEAYADQRYADICIREFVKKYGKKAFENSQLSFLRGWLNRSNKRYYI